MPGVLYPPVEEPAITEAHSEPIAAKTRVAQSFQRLSLRGFGARQIEAILLAISAVFFALHFVHLTADFPNYSAWSDWAKYTDEGWYGDAAIRHYLLGHWNVQGDFNPAAALPIWPAMELVLFRFTGVSLVAARALSVSIFGGILIAIYGLLRLWRIPARDQKSARSRAVSLAPAIAVALLATSNFCFAFTRLAILEPLLVLLTLLSLIVATLAGRAAALRPRMHGDSRPRWAYVWSAALGVLLPMAVLTKTTAVFLFPAVAWMLWAAGGSRLRPFLRTGLVAAGVAVWMWGGYYGLFVRPHFLVDYKYLFSANTYTGFKWSTLGSLLTDTLNDAVWISKPLFWLGVASMVWALLRIALVGLRRNPLITTLMLWILGYSAFLAYHANLQPRYYFVLAPAIFALVALGFEWVVLNLPRWPLAPRALRNAIVAIATAAVAYTGVRGTEHTISYLTYPEYTWVSAARQVADIVNRDASNGQSRLVLSISGSDLSLMTGLPSICDDFGTSDLATRVARYHPGWFATWNDVEDDKLEALDPLYRLQRVAAIPAFDDPDRNVLILYRLVPKATPEARPGTGAKRRSLQRGGLRTITAPLTIEPAG